MGDHQGRPSTVNLCPFVGVDLNLWLTVYIAESCWHGRKMSQILLAPNVDFNRCCWSWPSVSVTCDSKATVLSALPYCILKNHHAFAIFCIDLGLIYTRYHHNITQFCQQPWQHIVWWCKHPNQPDLLKTISYRKIKVENTIGAGQQGRNAALLW